MYRGECRAHDADCQNDTNMDYVYIIITDLYFVLAASFFIFAIVFDYRFRSYLKANFGRGYLQLEPTRQLRD